MMEKERKAFESKNGRRLTQPEITGIFAGKLISLDNPIIKPTINKYAKTKKR